MQASTESTPLAGPKRGADEASCSLDGCMGAVGEGIITGVLSALAAYMAFLCLEASDALWTKAAIQVVLPVTCGITAMTTAVLAQPLLTRVRKQRTCAPFTLAAAVRNVVVGNLLAVALAFVGISVARQLSSRHLDDVTPTRAGCPFLPAFRSRPHAKYLWIIPLGVDGTPMSANSSWSAEMRRLRDEEGFILGMHGLDHYREWGRCESGGPGTDAPGVGCLAEFEALDLASARHKVNRGVAIWRAAFNATPTHFSFPAAFGTREIVRLVRDEYGMRVRTFGDVVFSKVYHCDPAAECRTGDFHASNLYCSPEQVDGIAGRGPIR